MQSSQNAGFFAIGVGALSILVIVSCSALSIRCILRRFISTQKPQHRPDSERYRDEDGTATEESEAAYSYQFQRVLVLVVSIVCFFGSLAVCVIATQSPSSTRGIEQWLQFGAWVCHDH
jgi:hypothetical protein